MATKTKGSGSKRTSSSGNGSSQRSSRSKATGGARTGSSRSTQSARRSNGGGPAGSASRSPKQSSSKGRSGSNGQSTSSGKGRSSGSAIGKAASKAKVPLLAGGAAVAGAAGGLALGARQANRHSRLGRMVPKKPQVKVSSKDLASAAKEVGNFGAQLGRLATELKETREASNGKHRSPVEVVLDGLTARRSGH